MRDVVCTEEGCILEEPHNSESHRREDFDRDVEQVGRGYVSTPDMLDAEGGGLAPKEASYLVPLRDGAQSSTVSGARRRKRTAVTRRKTAKRIQTGGGQRRRRPRTKVSRRIGTRKPVKRRAKVRTIQIGGGRKRRRNPTSSTRRACVPVRSTVRGRRGRRH